MAAPWQLRARDCNVPQKSLSENLPIPLKGKEQIENHLAIVGIIPDLDQIDAICPVKNRMISVKTLTIFQNFIPIAGI